MPPPRRGKKGKGKRKGSKKKKKGPKPIPPPPPLHHLTEIYKKLIDSLRSLFEMRIAARKKRIEAWFMTQELTDLKNDNALYRDYLTDNIEDLEDMINKFKNLIQEIRDAIAEAVAERMAKLQKLLEEYEARITELEKELLNIRSQLLEFEALMIELAGLLAKIQELLQEIEAAKADAKIKIRHLTNQFLAERGRLHNHLEEQLFNLIKFCRSYLMPVLWNFMQNIMTDNKCLRWKLARTDEKNIILADKRQEKMKRRKLLTLEKPYWDIQWAFFKLCEMDALKGKKKRHEDLETKVSATGFANIPIKDGDTGSIDAVSRLIHTTQLGKDFNVFLVQRLTAAKEAQERHERGKRREEKRFLKQLLDTAQALKEGREDAYTSKGYLSADEHDEDWEEQEEPYTTTVAEGHNDEHVTDDLDKQSSGDDDAVDGKKTRFLIYQRILNKLALNRVYKVAEALTKYLKQIGFPVVRVMGACPPRSKVTVPNTISDLCLFE